MVVGQKKLGYRRWMGKEGEWKWGEDCFNLADIVAHDRQKKNPLPQCENARFPELSAC